MNYLDTYDLTRPETPNPTDPSPAAQPTLNEEVNQVIGQLGRFWGGFRKQVRLFRGQKRSGTHLLPFRLAEPNSARGSAQGLQRSRRTCAEGVDEVHRGRGSTESTQHREGGGGKRQR